MPQRARPSSTTVLGIKSSTSSRASFFNDIGPGPTMTWGLQELALTEAEWPAFKGLKSSRAVLYANRSRYCLAAGVGNAPHSSGLDPVGMISMTIRIFSNGRDQR